MFYDAYRRHNIKCLLHPLTRKLLSEQFQENSLMIEGECIKNAARSMETRFAALETPHNATLPTARAMGSVIDPSVSGFQ
jgi:hypothetical protein